MSSTRQATADSERLTACMARFNLAPWAGLTMLFESGLLRRDPKDIALFLKTNTVSEVRVRRQRVDLSKKAVGSFIGGAGATNDERRALLGEILSEYLSLFSFTGMALDEALRAWLQEFRLPGEAQMIDRLMNAFSAKYCQCNPSTFGHPDTAYVLSFALIMLNTDLHNPSVKHKMSREAFIKMNRGVNGGADVPSTTLAAMYNNIKKRGFEVGPETFVVTFFGTRREGWLLKRSTNPVKRWNKRFFVLNDNCLYYFKAEEDVQTGNPQCLIPLDNIDVEAMTDSSDALRMYSTIPGTSIKSAKKPRGARGSFVQGKHEDFVLRASSGRDRDAWVNALKLEVTRGPFMRLIDSKRRQAAALSTMDPFAARLSRESITNVGRRGSSSKQPLVSHGSGSGAAGGTSGASKSYSTFQTSPAFGGPASLEPHSGMDQYGRDLMGDEGRFGALFGTPLGRDSPGRADAHHGHEDSMQGMQPRFSFASFLSDTIDLGDDSQRDLSASLSMGFGVGVGSSAWARADSVTAQDAAQGSQGGSSGQGLVTAADDAVDADCVDLDLMMSPGAGVGASRDTSVDVSGPGVTGHDGAAHQAGPARTSGTSRGHARQGSRGTRRRLVPDEVADRVVTSPVSDARQAAGRQPQYPSSDSCDHGDLDGILSAVLPPSSPSPAPSPFHHRTASGGFSALAVASALAQSGSPAPSPARPLLAGSSLLAHVTGTSAPAGHGYLPMVEGGSRGPTRVHSSDSDSEGSVTSDSSVELPISSNPTRERVLAAQRT